MEQKKLYRSRNNKILAGICGGVGDYLNIDPVIIRIIALLLLFFSFGFAILLYLCSWVLIPLEPDEYDAQVKIIYNS